MAHPTIDINSEPSLVCPNPAYNCVNYEFDCTDFLVSAGTAAQFVIDCSALSVASIAPAGVLLIASNSYLTSATENNYQRINTSAVLTSTLLASRIKAALEANSNIFTDYTVALSGAGSDIITVTAREVGVKSDFSFSYGGFAATGITNSETNGTDAVYLDNYRLIVEIWESSNGVPTKQISKESYIPNSNGLFSINIGRKVAPLLKSRFVFSLPFPSNVNFDDLISKTFMLRYGEMYSDSLDECRNRTRDFATSSEILVVNSAFQRADASDKTAEMCANEFMTNTPEYTEMCENSVGYLWIWLEDILVFPAPVGVVYSSFWEIFYTDGTSDSVIGSSLPSVPVLANGFVCVQSGWDFISFYSDPLKVASYYRVRFVVRDTALPIPTGDTYYGSKYFKIVPCCEGQVEMYFQNEYGGFDTITFTQLSSIDIAQENAVFESFLDCADAVIANDGTGAKGKGIINQSARDVFEVTSKFADSYQSRLWLREFLTSPEKYVRHTIQGESEIFSKVILVDGSAKYYSKDDNTLVLKFNYYLNEDLNLQKN